MAHRDRVQRDAEEMRLREQQYQAQRDAAPPAEPAAEERTEERGGDQASGSDGAVVPFERGGDRASN